MHGASQAVMHGDIQCWKSERVSTRAATAAAAEGLESPFLIASSLLNSTLSWLVQSIAGKREESQHIPHTMPDTPACVVG